ncbi:response regulator transcription factor [bacterium]|nr:response regulator transcription factor [bacterium]MBU4134204.1 response regulator transcription factor [bacterium]
MGAAKNSDVILVVEDDKNIAKLLKVSLGMSGYHSVFVRNGADGIKKLRAERISMILLDLGLPDINGWEVLRFVKNDNELFKIPIIVITGEYKRTVDSVKALDEGADDYIIKPFSPRVLLSRMKAILRRSGNGDSPISKILSTENNELSLDLDLRILSLLLPSGEKKIIDKLTVKEFDLLVCFLKHQRRVFSRQYIFELVWDRDYYGTTRTIDKHIGRLRAKLGAYGKFIRSVPGVGYQFDTEGGSNDW